jgi:hypothetical protein
MGRSVQTEKPRIAKERGRITPCVERVEVAVGMFCTTYQVSKLR